ncbi:MAG: ABC-F family ATP-binding cassette domain-containing protein, partial [Demequinaceae bacterium]|nr:ABC-F family ATP-binding cassette domain-containing protein [Demequinaceae bacterium]
MSSLTFSHVSLAFGEGVTVFRDLTLTLPPGLSGVVGRNGIGKSTLLRLAAGTLAPSSGTITRPELLSYVPQDVALAADATVAEVLGVGPTIAALRAIEQGSTERELYEAVGEDWLVEDRARSVMASLGLGAIGVDRTVGQISGGEATLLAVGAAVLAQPDVLLLDEPTNNLDDEAR